MFIYWLGLLKPIALKKGQNIHKALTILSVTGLTLLLPETKISEFANSVHLDEVAHHEQPHLDLHCLPSSL